MVGYRGGRFGNYGTILSSLSYKVEMPCKLVRTSHKMMLNPNFLGDTLDG